MKKQGAFKKSSDLSFLCKKTLISEDVESVTLVGVKRSRKHCARLIFRFTSVVLPWSHPDSSGYKLRFFWNTITFSVKINEGCHEKMERELRMKIPRVVSDKQDSFCYNLHFQECKFCNLTPNSNINSTVSENIIQKSATVLLNIMRE